MGSMKRVGWWLILGGLAASSTASCADSGQTGSPSCAAPQSCVCESLAGRILTRATLSELGQSDATLVVEQVLTPSEPFGPADVGRKISGSFSATQPCDAAPLKRSDIGDTVLLTFRADEYFYDYCAGYTECRNSNVECGNLTAAACIDHCAGLCVPDRSASPISLTLLQLLPWTDPIDLGDGTSVSMSDAAQVTNFDTCAERYPPAAGPAPACNDTPTSSNGCALFSGAPVRGSDAPGLVACSFVALALASARRHRRTRRRASF